jgi:hypothetical protein
VIPSIRCGSAGSAAKECKQRHYPPAYVRPQLLPIELHMVTKGPRCRVHRQILPD